MATMKYAQVPKFTYQKFDSNHHYQTFDRQTLSFTYHPIVPKPSVSLPLEDEKKEEKEKAADTAPEKGGAEQTTEENTPKPPEESPSPDNDSKSFQNDTSLTC